MPTRKAVRIKRESEAIADVVGEFHSAKAKFAPYNSLHEGYAVIKEELDELWEAVRSNGPDRVSRSLQEATQVAATALRFICDITNKYRQG